jgi:hypothetical protein
MNKSIISYLEDLPDERRRAGQRHEQTFILLLVLMSTMSGYHGYRSIGDFITRNETDLLTQLKPKKGRLPTFYTVRRVIQNLDFDQLSESFYKWTRQHTDITENEWLHVDGKAMKGTMSDYSLERQRFVNLVSVYSSRKKLVIGNALVDNGKESEIPVVQRLIEDLGLSGVTFTLDALHCQKKL